MRDDTVVPSLGGGLPETGVKRCLADRPRFRFLARGRVALLLAAAIGLPWLPIPDAPPKDVPMHRARGRPGAFILHSAFGPGGKIIATSNEQGHLTVRSAAEGWGIGHPIDVPGFVRAMAFSPDGRHLAIGREEPDILLCELGGEERPRPLGIPVRSTSDLRYSPDARALAVSSHSAREIIVWDMEAGRRRITLHGHTGPVVTMAYAPDGRSLASWGLVDRSIFIWDIDTGRTTRRLIVPPGPVCCLAYSPDGRLLAAASTRRDSVRIWDIRTGEQVRLIAGRSLPIRSVAFSPDGGLLATGSDDGTAGLWSIATGRELRRLDGGTHVLTHVAFSADGLTLLANGKDDDIRVWDLGGLGPVD